MTSPYSERCPPTDDGRCKGRPVRQDCQAHHAVAAVTRGRAQPPQRSGSCILDGAVRSSAAGTRVGSGDTHSNSLQDKRAQEARAGHESHHRAGRFHRAGGWARATTGRAQGRAQATGRGWWERGCTKQKGQRPHLDHRAQLSSGPAGIRTHNAPVAARDSNQVI